MTKINFVRASADKLQIHEFDSVKKFGQKTRKTIEQGFRDEIDIKMDDTIEDVNAKTSQYINRRYGTLIKKLSFFYGLWVVIVFAVFFTTIRFSGENLEGVFFIIFFPLILYSAFFANVKMQMLHLFYKQFAQTNSYTYEKQGSTNDLTGALFKVGHTKKMVDVIRGKFNDHPLTIFNYTFTTGSGKNSVKHDQTVFEIDFDVVLPPVLLLTDHHNFGDDLSDNNLTKVSKIDLPGELEKHFNLFAEKKYEIEALQIFTPDILAYLYDNYKGFNYDFSGRRFYLYSKKVIIKKKDLYGAYKLAQFIINRLSKELKRMEGSVKSMNEVFRNR